MFGSPLTVIHNAPLATYSLIGRNRIYVSTSALQEAHSESTNLGSLCLAFDNRRKPVFRLPSDESQSQFNEASNADIWAILKGAYPTYPDAQQAHLMRKDLEICLVPEVDGDERQLKMAREVRDALELYERTSQQKYGTKGYLGKLKIVVGDDIPACACCGARR